MRALVIAAIDEKPGRAACRPHFAEGDFQFAHGLLKRRRDASGKPNGLRLVYAGTLVAASRARRGADRPGVLFQPLRPLSRLELVAAHADFRSRSRHAVPWRAISGAMVALRLRAQLCSPVRGRFLGSGERNVERNGEGALRQTLEIRLLFG